MQETGQFVQGISESLQNSNSTPITVIGILEKISHFSFLYSNEINTF